MIHQGVAQETTITTVHYMGHIGHIHGISGTYISRLGKVSLGQILLL